jgi:hypothetical protein
MARAVGKATKKRGARRKPKKRSNKGRPRRAKFDIATLMAKLGVRVRRVVVAPSALTDPAGTDAQRRGLPALDPALLPELVLLQHAAIQHFHLRPNSPACSSKQELIDFFMRVRLSNGSQLRRHLASALATCVRPLSAMAGGRPRKKPRPPNDEQNGRGRAGQL